MLDSEDDIRGLLTRATAPAPKVDLADVVAKWRRRRSRRRWAGTATAISLVLLVVATSLVVARAAKHPAPAKPPTCTAAPLPMPAGYDRGVYTMEIDPTGRYIVGTIYNFHDSQTPGFTGDSHVLWSDGVPTVITVDSRTPYYLSLPNAQGVAWGVEFHYPHSVAFRYQNGVVTTLHSPVPDTWDMVGGGGGFITEDGTIMLSARSVSPVTGVPGPWVPIAWAPGAIEGHIVHLPFDNPVLWSYSGGHVVVESLSRIGAPAGFYVTDLSGSHPYPLRGPDGLTATPYVFNGDWAWGISSKPNHPDQAINVRWDLRDGSFDVVAHEGPVNAKGWMVYGIPTGKGGKNVRYVLDKSGPVETLLPPRGTDGSAFHADSLADDGTIVGMASKGHGPDARQIPVVWHC